MQQSHDAASIAQTEGLQSLAQPLQDIATIVKDDATVFEWVAEAPAKEGSAEAEGEPPSLTLLLLCAVGMLEGVDMALLPASAFSLRKDIGFQLTDLACLTVAQGVTISLAAPLWGVLADRGVLRRRSILVIGSLGQGLITIALATTTALWSMIVLRAIVGGLVAALRPISNGIIADVTSEGKRGKIFGRVQCSILVGMFLSSMIVGNMSQRTVLGLSGWRVAYGVVGLLATAVAALEAGFLREPPVREAVRQPTERASRGRRSWLSAIHQEVRDSARFLTIPTFCVMIMQGILGTIPWTAMGNMMLYFQLGGIEVGKASVLTGGLPVAGAFGILLGGHIADLLAARFGYHGRPLSAQITVALGIPLVWLIFGGVPPGTAGFWEYFALIVAFGLLGSWAQSGTTFPVLSEIVPAEARSRVMAWQCALENSVANLLGPPVVTLLATKAFGFTFGEQDGSGKDLHAAAALGKAMRATICIPWCATLAAYTLLHWTYPRDVRRLLAQTERAKKGAAKPEP